MTNSASRFNDAVAAAAAATTMPELVQALRVLHAIAGKPSGRSLAEKSKGGRDYVSSTSISEKLRLTNPKPLSQEFVRNYVKACGAEAEVVKAFENEFIRIETAPLRAKVPEQRADEASAPGILPEHLATLDYIAEVADVLDGDEGHEVARSIYQHIYDVCRRLLGDSHVRTEQAARDLGAVLAELQHYTRAYELLDLVLVAYTTRYGADHPNTLAVMDNLAIVQIGREKYSNAVALASQSLAARRLRSDDAEHLRHTADILIHALECDGDDHEAELLRQEFASPTPTTRPPSRTIRKFLRRRGGTDRSSGPSADEDSAR